jgi:hypothetical protein
MPLKITIASAVFALDASESMYSFSKLVISLLENIGSEQIIKILTANMPEILDLKTIPHVIRKITKKIGLTMSGRIL